MPKQNNLDLTRELIRQNEKRLTELVPMIEKCVGKIGVGISGVYNVEETSATITYLRSILNQMDSDLMALDELICE